MLRQGWALATSPHGANQTIFNPGMSGMPELRAMVSIVGPSAKAGDHASAKTGANIATAQTTLGNRRNFMGSTMPGLVEWI
jgi:hypothetical protein